MAPVNTAENSCSALPQTNRGAAGPHTQNHEQNAGGSDRDGDPVFVSDRAGLEIFRGRRGDVLQLSKSGQRAIGRVGRAPSHAATPNKLLMN